MRTGFSEVVGSWGTRLSTRPRMLFQRAALQSGDLGAFAAGCCLARGAVVGEQVITAWAVVVLPGPIRRPGPRLRRAPPENDRPWTTRCSWPLCGRGGRR